MITSGEFSEALNHLDSINDIELKLWKSSIIHEKIGEFNEALETALELEKITTSKEFLLRSLISQAYALWRLSRLDDWEIVLERGRNILEHNQNLENYHDFMGEFYYLNGIRQNILSKNMDALDSFRKSLEHRQIHGDMALISHSLNALGIMHEILGKLNQAYDYHIQALEIKRKVGSKQDIYRSLSNLGVLFERLGEFNEAMSVLEEGLSIATGIGLEEEATVFLRSMANVERKRNRFKESEDHLKELNYIESKLYGKLTLSTLFSYIKLYTKQEDLVSAQTYLVQLDKQFPDDTLKFSKLVQKQLVKIYFQLHHPRPSYKLKVQDTLRDLLKDIERIESEQQIEIYVYLARSLIFELQQYEDSEIIIELQAIINELGRIATSNQLVLEELEVMELKAKIYQIEGKMQKARTILYDAAELAREKGYLIRSKRFTEQMDLFNLETKHLTSLNAHITKLELDHVLSRLISESSNSSPVITEEHPIMVLILNEGGSSLYEFEFDRSSNFNHSSLVGSFVSAIQKFGDEIFVSSKHKFNRIEHSGFSILSGKIESLLAVYVYKGNSYHATSRFDRLITDLSKIDFVGHLTRKYQKLAGMQKEAIDDVIQFNFSDLYI